MAGNSTTISTYRQPATTTAVVSTHYSVTMAEITREPAYLPLCYDPFPLLTFGCRYQTHEREKSRNSLDRDSRPRCLGFILLLGVKHLRDKRFSWEPNATVISRDSTSCNQRGIIDINMDFPGYLSSMLTIQLTRPSRYHCHKAWALSQHENLRSQLTIPASRTRNLKVVMLCCALGNYSGRTLGCIMA